MRVDKLKVGGVFKNYKMVCEVLGEKVRSGKAKQLQLAKWREQFSWVMQRYEWRIVKIHPNPEAEMRGLTTAAAVGLGIVGGLLGVVYSFSLGIVIMYWLSNSLSSGHNLYPV